jgi:hypothetical protein
MACSTALPSKALTLSPDTFNGPGAGATSAVVTGAFDEVATFTLTGPGTFSASFSATNSYTQGGASGFIENFVMSLFKGSPPPPGSGEIVPDTAAIPIGPGSQQTSFTSLLTAGTYFLRFSGTGITGPFASFGASVSVADAAPGETPLPAAIPLFATGLGAMRQPSDLPHEKW